jgi:hypothetical protein
VLRLFQHLLPRALAWATTTPTGERAPAKRLRQYLEGLAGLPADVRTFSDLGYLDLLPRTTRELAAWEKQFALGSGGSVDDRRAKLAGAWAAAGGQSPDYIQRTLHAAGFTMVFVHEWWESGPPYVARDPRLYVTQPLLGVYQCETVSPWECFAPAPGEPLAPHCDETLANDPHYLVNLNLTRRAPPPVPDDPSSWPYFLYLGAETFPDLAPVGRSRIAELKELILRIAPAQQWIVLLVEPVDEVEGFGSSEFGSAPFGA